jgi:hypothetical protein
VTWRLKATIVAPEKMSIARQLLGKHIPMAVNIQTTLEELLEALSCVWPMPKLYREDQQDTRQENKVMGPTGPETNDCVGEGQQQITRPDPGPQKIPK